MGFRGRMPREERAKQFMPFAALKGYSEALRRKEKIVVDKIQVSEDYAEELDRRLRQVRKMDVVTVIYFRKGEYLKLTGVVSCIDLNGKMLKIVQTKIPIMDILEVTGEHIAESIPYA